MLRSACNYLYLACGVIAAVSLAGIAVVTLAQIIARPFGYAFEATELAGFLLASSTFLGLAYTFVNGGHVRINLIRQVASPGLMRLVEVWCCVVGMGVTGYAGWRMAIFAFQTFTYNELSPGMLALPMWVPQAGIALGLAVMCIGLVEQATLILAGRTAQYEINIDSTSE